MYNDHHFHYGYFIYAAATVAKFDSAWRDQYRAPLKDLMVDYIGLFEFVDGRNQESFCEAANAYYAAALLASVLGNQPLATLGATLAAVEALAGQTLMHVPLASSNPHPSLSPGYNVFAPPADMEKRVGIQVLPVSPFLTHLFPDHEFAKQLVEWAQPVLTRATTHEWRNFAWALQALYDPQGARTNIAALTAFDDGNSKTNMLWRLIQYILVFVHVQNGFHMALLTCIVNISIYTHGIALPPFFFPKHIGLHLSMPSTLRAPQLPCLPLSTPPPCPTCCSLSPSLQPSFPLSPTSPPRWRMAIGGNKEALQSLQ
ncbi:unnamed protein product [Closterium sp. NIES-64]|nr:unnamed protein product [Closterium sp. NIES-64]